MSLRIQALNSPAVDHKRLVETNCRRASLTFIVLRWLVSGLLRLLFRVEVRGLEHLPREGGYIFAGNHLSWLDPFLMLAFAPAQPRIYFLGARENMHSSAWRRFMTDRIGGVIPVDRGQGKAHFEIAHRVERVLAGGGVLGIFPEGTVSPVETGHLLPFKKGVGHFAAHSGVPIVPVAFSGTKQPWLRKHITMTIGAPTPVQPDAGRNEAERLTVEAAARIQAILPMPQPVSPHDPQLLKQFFTELF